MKRLYKILALLPAATLVAATMVAPVQADPPRRAWHHNDIRHFEGRDRHAWRSGHWHNGRHGGRLGWWWVVGGAWYLYNAPVYPYPNPYVPPVVVVEPPPAVAPAPVVVAPPVEHYWYYCETSQTYYPYVASCATEWKQVPATPAPPNVGPR